MNNITKTIKESLESFDLVKAQSAPFTVMGAYKDADFERIKSHLLQSQIRLIEAIIVNSKKGIRVIKSSAKRSPHLRSFYVGKWQALEEQISFLNETLEELKKSL